MQVYAKLESSFRVAVLLREEFFVLISSVMDLCMSRIIFGESFRCSFFGAQGENIAQGE